MHHLVNPVANMPRHSCPMHLVTLTIPVLLRSVATVLTLLAMTTLTPLDGQQVINGVISVLLLPFGCSTS
jgi:hypothetical protein